MAKKSRKLSGPGKRRATAGKGHNQWTYDQKLTLRLLFVDWEIDADTATAVFNTLFEEHLKACGLPQGLSASAIKAQFNERGRSGAAKQWKVICSDSIATDEVAKRDALNDQIGRILASLETNAQGLHAEPAQKAQSAPLTPPTTPAKRSRSLSSTASADLDVDEDDEDTDQRPSKRGRLHPQHAVVVISRQEQEAALRNLRMGPATPPKTPTKRARSSSRHRPDATVNYRLPSGAEIWLTPKQYKQTQADLTPPDEAVAHPHVPLLFRYSTPGCQSPLTNDGFLAGRFATTIIPPPQPPALENMPWSCVAQHLNRDQKIASPFISTSNNFVWIIRLALKERKRGATGGLISLISPLMLKKGSIFHAQPLHRELCKKRPFDKAAWFYHGMREFLIWAKVEKRALIATFPVEMLVDFATRNHGVGAVLRLEELGQENTSYDKKILPSFQQQNMKVNGGSIAAIAKVCKAVGLDISMVEAVGSVVTDIVMGYGLILEKKSTEEWQAAASFFSNEMCNGLRGTSLAEIQNMKYAFLDGCRWATGDFNSRQKSQKMKTMLGRAKKIGIEDPSQILMAELDDARASIGLLDQQQQMLLQQSSSQALLAEPDEVDDQIIRTPTRGRKCIASSSVSPDNDGIDGFESDGDGDSVIYDLEEDDDESIVYED